MMSYRVVQSYIFLRPTLIIMRKCKLGQDSSAHQLQRGAWRVARREIARDVIHAKNNAHLLLDG